MKHKIEWLLQKSLTACDIETPQKIHIERTRDSKHGDFASNIAMSLSKTLQKNPREIAENIIANLPQDEDVEKIEIAGPGFINFYLTTAALQKIVAEILDQDGIYGQSTIGQNQTVNIEFVSSNPTGPLHVGHGRHAAYGATVGNLLRAIGYKVHLEYYINDAGRQMQILAVSIWLRYLELMGETLTFPRNGYQGHYIIDIAKDLKIQYLDQFHRPLSDVFSDLPPDENDEGLGDKEKYIDALIIRAKQLIGEDRFDLILNAGLKAIIKDIRQDLEEFGVTFQEWFSEKSLLTNGDIDRGIAKLKAAGSLYEKDGAVWFKATDYGDEKDRVVIRENGQSTYFASDVGYHLNKYERGFDHIIDIFGSDHHGYMPRIKAFLKAADADVSKLQILLVQFAILYRGKQKVQMSTRSGSFVTLRELREEVGNDAARFFYVMRKSDQHLDFDLELAKSHSNENPVYYIQYAYARICSVERQLEQQNLTWSQTQGLANLKLLNTSHELALLRCAAQYPETILSAGLQYEPHQVVNYLQELANNFHTYYNASKFIVDEDELRNARLSLIMAVKVILNNGLKILGVSTPDVM